MYSKSIPLTKFADLPGVSMRFFLSTCVAAFVLLAGPAQGAAHSLGIVAPHGEETIAFDMNALGQVIAVLQDEDGNQDRKRVG
jgi:hypothetical protein